MLFFCDNYCLVLIGSYCLVLIECNCYLVLLGSYFLGDNRCLIVYGVEEVKDEIKVTYLSLSQHIFKHFVFSHIEKWRTLKRPKTSSKDFYTIKETK